MESNFDSSPASTTTTTTAFETCSAQPASFMENQQKPEISPIPNKNHTKSHVLDYFNWADDDAELHLLPIAPTKQPRDISGLQSLSKNPFSSLQHRHWKSQNLCSFYLFATSVWLLSPLSNLPSSLTNLSHTTQHPTIKSFCFLELGSRPMFG